MISPDQRPITATSSLNAILYEYLAHRINCGECWRSQLATTIRRFEKWLGREAIVSDLNKRTLFAFLQAVATERCPRTANSRRTGLVALWNYLADELELLPPPGKLPKMKVPRRIPIAWSLDEMTRIVASANEELGWWNGVALLADGDPRVLGQRRSPP